MDRVLVALVPDCRILICLSATNVINLCFHPSLIDDPRASADNIYQRNTEWTTSVWASSETHQGRKHQTYC